MDKPKLFTVGPTYVNDDVRAEMSNQMFSHRDAEYVKLHKELIEKLRKFFQTQNEIFIYTSSSTGCMESSVRNCISEHGTGLSMVCGAFGKRFNEIIAENGRNAVRSEVPWGKANLGEHLEEALSKNPGVEAVTITHCETSTSVLNPLEELCKVAKEHDVLTLVDTVSSMGGTDIPIDRLGIDFCFFGVQKCFGVPPGLAIATVSKKALEKAATVKNRGHYFDFLNLKKFNDKHMVPYTPPMPQMIGLSKQLDLIFEEGINNRFERHRKVSARVRDKCKELGFSVFPDEKYASPTLSCISVQQGFDLKGMYAKMNDRGFVLASGYDKLKETTFRVGNMGNVTMDDVNEMLENLEEVIQ
jgi:aspartate aminotransferase-like enzyme